MLDFVGFISLIVFFITQQEVMRELPDGKTLGGPVAAKGVASRVNLIMRSITAMRCDQSRQATFV